MSKKGEIIAAKEYLLMACERAELAYQNREADTPYFDVDAMADKYELTDEETDGVMNWIVSSGSLVPDSMVVGDNGVCAMQCSGYRLTDLGRCEIAGIRASRDLARDAEADARVGNGLERSGPNGPVPVKDVE